MTSSGSGAEVDPGFFEEVYDLGPLDLGAARQTTVRVVYADSPSVDNVGTWLAKYAPHDMEFGLDIEWRPNRCQGDDNPAAVLQLAGKHGCLLIQLLQLRWIPRALSLLLSDRNVKLAGVGIHQDCAKLTRDFGFDIRAQKVDLSKRAADVMNSRDLKGAGVARLCAQFWTQPLRKNKRVTLSNWEAESLSGDQIIYAATDAFICYHLLVALNEVFQKNHQVAQIGTDSSMHRRTTGIQLVYQ